MNILLINPPCRGAYFIPIGLGYVASVVKQEKHNVEILDINCFRYSSEEVEKIIRGSEFDVVGIGGLTSTYKYVKWLAGAIKKHKPRVPVVAGNMVSTAHPELLLKNSEVDIAVIDEGELTFKEVVSTIERNGNLDEVRGIFYKDRGNITKTPPRERISDLDSIPFPAWDLFRMDKYLTVTSPYPVSFGLRAISISSVRGCPYECTFCSHPFGRRVHTRSARGIVDEIKELKKRYGIEYIYFSDDLFLVNEKRILELCDRMIAERFNIKWHVAGRVNLVNVSLLKKMRRAGCIEMGYGFESGSQAILDKLKKRVTVKQAEEAIKMTRAAGINVLGSFIFGMPGETQATINETLDFIKRTQLPIYRFFYATPYPDTELYDIAKTMGRLPLDEDKYIENLGEMRTTFLVNLTDFSDSELVRLKNSAEATAKKNLNFKLRFKEFAGDWRRRYYTVRFHVKNSGIRRTLKKIFSKIRLKLLNA